MLLSMNRGDEYELEQPQERSWMQWHKFTAQDAVSSTFGPPLVVAIWRFIACGALIGLLIDADNQGRNSGATAPITATLSFLHTAIICGYMGIGVILAIVYRIVLKKTAAYAGNTHPEPVPMGYKFHWVFFEVCLTAATLVTIMFWVLIFDYDNPVTLPDATMHIINLGVMVVDFAICRYIPQFVHVFIPFILVGAAMCYILIYHAATGVYLYEFVDLDEKPPTWYFVTPLLAAVLHIVWCAIGLGKAAALRACSPARSSPASVSLGSSARGGGAVVSGDAENANMGAHHQQYAAFSDATAAQPGAAAGPYGAHVAL